MTKRAIRTLAFEQAAWDRLAPELDQELETGWVLLARMVGSPEAGDLTLLVNHVAPVPEDAYDKRLPNALSIRTAGGCRRSAGQPLTV